MIEYIIVLSEESEFTDELEEFAIEDGTTVLQSASSSELIGALGQVPPSVILLDFACCSGDIVPLLRTVSRQYYDSRVYVFNAPSNGKFNESTRKHLTGTYETGSKPEIIYGKIKENESLLDMLREQDIFGHSPALLQAARTISQVSKSDVTVLIGGESGTGKELYARAIHNLSSRAGRPFIPVNCGAIAEGILESELFGHEKGAYTGAASRRQGFFEQANGGTIFLDEIGEIKPEVQVRLLRVLEQRAFMRVGGTEQISVDVRVIAASNRDLRSMTHDGEFREDLFYRLSVVSLIAAPLRERAVDIMPILKYFIAQRSSSNIRIEPGAVEMLLRYSWPGNIRELRNFVDATLATETGGVITSDDVSEYIDRQSRTSRQLPVASGHTRETIDSQLIYQALLKLAQEVAGLKDIILEQVDAVKHANNIGGVHHTGLDPSMDLGSAGDSSTNGDTTIAEMERRMIVSALNRVGGNRRKAAEMLGIGQRTLYRKLKQYGIK